MKTHAIHVTQTAGCCRWCRCTERDPCEGGCGWANKQHTLCTACEDLDHALRTVVGRLVLATFLHGSGFRTAATPVATTRPARTKPTPAARRARR